MVNHFDLSINAAFRQLLAWIRNGLVKVLFAATPCSSFSRARRAPPWSRFPRQIRSATYPHGLPGLEGKDLDTCNLGNRLSKRAACLIKAAIECSVPGGEENPKLSYIFDCHGRVSRQKLPSVHSVFLDQCAYGTPYRKSTRIDF